MKDDCHKNPENDGGCRNDNDTKDINRKRKMSDADQNDDTINKRRFEGESDDYLESYFEHCDAKDSQSRNENITNQILESDDDSSDSYSDNLSNPDVIVSSDSDHDSGYVTDLILDGQDDIFADQQIDQLPEDPILDYYFNSDEILGAEEVYVDPYYRCHRNINEEEISIVGCIFDNDGECNQCCDCDDVPDFCGRIAIQYYGDDIYGLDQYSGQSNDADDLL